MVLKETAYNSSTDTLTVIVGGGTKENTPEVCDADFLVRNYKATITFTNSLPSRVVAEENDEAGEDQLTIANVSPNATHSHRRATESNHSETTIMD